MELHLTAMECHLSYGITQCYPGPALGMFELFGRTGPPILGGPPFWTLKTFHINYVGQFEQLWCLD